MLRSFFKSFEQIFKCKKIEKIHMGFEKLKNSSEI